jgi:hypothetical protein
MKRRRGRVITMRDLLRDLELCEKATPGPWVKDERGGCVAVYPRSIGEINCMDESEGKRIFYKGGYQVLDEDGRFKHWEVHPQDTADAEFVAQAREGWPHAIERALKAEAEVEKLQNELETLRAQVENLKWREETILRWSIDSCCPPGMMGNGCPERSCGQCFREALDREEVQGRGQDLDTPYPGASTEGDLYRELGELKAENSMLRVANGLLKRRKKVLDEALTLAVLAQVGVEASEKPDLVKSYPDFRKLVNERKQKYISIAEREPDTSKEGCGC